MGNLCFAALVRQVIWAALLMAAAGVGRGAEPQFEPIFDGKTLGGWETPEPKFWTVENGAIVARITREQPCRTNQYLVWQGGDVADFELKLKSRVNGEGAINNGFQFRSRLLPDHDICGYQVDNNLLTPWLVRLYEEYGRHSLAMRGEAVILEEGGARKLERIAEAAGDAWFRLEDWHEYHLVCIGRKIALKIDGRLAAEVEDRDERRGQLQGVVALQLHGGGPTKAEFKDIQLRVLKAPGKAADTTSAVSGKGPREVIRAGAVAWWALDSGGHGARPPLRHLPEWEQFALNVRAWGPGSRPAERAVVLDGAHFVSEALSFPQPVFTAYVRVCDPQNRWSGPLLVAESQSNARAFSWKLEARGNESKTVSFVLNAPGADVAVNFPLPSEGGKVWRDLVGRYDGRTLALFCDGKYLGSRAIAAAPVAGAVRVLIAGEASGGRVSRTFRGELAEAALWDRALTDEEIAVLSRYPAAK